MERSPPGVSPGEGLVGPSHASPDWVSAAGGPRLQSATILNTRDQFRGSSRYALLAYQLPWHLAYLSYVIVV